MQALKVAVVAMGILIVAGVVVLGVALTQRMSGNAAPLASLMLDEPPGTRIAGVALAPDRMAVTLTGAGPDRIVLIDLKSGRTLGRTALAR